MADHATLRDTVWIALAALPKPVTREAVDACTKEILPGKENGEFAHWLETNESYLLGRLNGN